LPADERPAPALRELAEAAGLDLASYRSEHVAERISRACSREHVASPQALARLLRGDDEARARFRRSVAVSVSGLFRDRTQFDLLERELLPPLLERPGRFRAWSAGCSDGSELYTLAFLLKALGTLDRAFLLGSDVLAENVERARRADYPEVVISEAMRAHVRFEQRDLLRDPPPPGRFGLVLCRNVAIYFSPERKRQVYEVLASSLIRGGVLLLGKSERLAAPAELGLERAADHAYRRWDRQKA
jgi:chemotaxis protein methyltransferase CheR